MSNSDCIIYHLGFDINNKNSSEINIIYLIKNGNKSLLLSDLFIY